MRCAKAQRLIALDASGDATPSQQRRALDHTRRCEDCRSFAAEPLLPLASLRTVQPLRDSDFAAIRSRVLSEVADRRARRVPLLSALRPRFAVAFALAMLVAVGALLSVRSTTPDASPLPRPLPEIVATNTIAPPAPALTPQAAAPPSPIVATSRPARRRPRPHRVPAIAIASASPAPAPEMRIEIQTADPEVRIIWIVHSKLDEPTTLIKENS